MRENTTEQVKLFLGLIGFGLLSRFLPHPPNSTALGAIALLAGSHFGMRWLGFLAPLVVLVLSDLIIGFHNSMIYVYASVALSVALGHWCLKRWSWRKLIGTSFLSSFSFFLITNLGVWFSSGLYPVNTEGLLRCFVMAIPFFQTQLFGDLMFAGIVFGIYQLAQRVSILKRRSSSAFPGRHI